MKEQLYKLFGYTIKLTDNISVSIHTFAELFSDAERLTYNELMNVEKEKNYGYRKYIEKWKKEGIIE